MLVNTTATIVTRENYNVAVACLDPEFALTPVKKVLGGVLVINELTAVGDSITLINSFYDLEHFENVYRFVGTEKGGFRKAEYTGPKAMPRPAPRPYVAYSPRSPRTSRYSNLPRNTFQQD